MSEAHDECFILGSGSSVNRLTTSERSYINQSPCRLAVNKFAAFHQKCGLRPSHVFFLDDHSPSCRKMLQYIFDIAARDGLRDITFVLNAETEHAVRRCSALARFARRVVCSVFGLGTLQFYWFRRGSPDEHWAYQIPPDYRLQFASHSEWLAGGDWATSLDQPLYHFRGSLTSALNYLSIVYPGRTIKLIGCDFNSSEYFFQDELEGLPFAWQDWTTPLVEKAGVHFSAQDFEGTTMFDRFDEVLEGLASTGNRLVCCNQDSLLVETELVEYEPVLRELSGRAAW